MTDEQEKNLRDTFTNLMAAVKALEEGQHLLSSAMMKLIGRVAELERAQGKPKSKLVGLNGHPMS